MGDLALQHHGRQISGEDDADSGDNTLLIQVGGVTHDRQPVRVDVAGIAWPWRSSGK